MDVVYSFRFDRFAWNRQLIYSIRSIYKHARNNFSGKIYIIGADPKLNGILHIDTHDNFTAAINIKNKLAIACDLHDLSEDFLYMADDHYFIKDVDMASYPYYTNGFLDDLLPTQKNVYQLNIKSTIAALHPIRARNFNIHCPIRYNKTRLKIMLNGCTWNTMGMLCKSMYGNIFNLYEGKEMKDCKIRSNFEIDDMMKRIEGRDCFSTGKENENKNIGALLQILYPKKSPHEQ